MTSGSRRAVASINSTSIRRAGRGVVTIRCAAIPVVKAAAVTTDGRDVVPRSAVAEPIAEEGLVAIARAAAGAATTAVGIAATTAGTVTAVAATTVVAVVAAATPAGGQKKKSRRPPTITPPTTHFVTVPEESPPAIKSGRKVVQAVPA
jgi:hypothetical protein